MENIFGKGNIQLYWGGTVETIPAEHGTGWILMVGRKPRIIGHTFEAQSDGTWLDVTTQNELDKLAADAIDGPDSVQKYNTVSNLLEDLPVPPAVTFMIIYNELQEYAQHGTIGKLLLNVVQVSGMTGAQVVNYLTPLMEDLSVALGKMIGRRIK